MLRVVYLNVNPVSSSPTSLKSQTWGINTEMELKQYRTAGNKLLHQIIYEVSCTIRLESFLHCQLSSACSELKLKCYSRKKQTMTTNIQLIRKRGTCLSIIMAINSNMKLPMTKGCNVTQPEVPTLELKLLSHKMNQHILINQVYEFTIIVE